MMIWTNLLQIYKNIVLKMKNIIQLDHSELPDNVDDARCLAGLLGQVANESVAICKQVDPNSIPGGMNSVLSENTQGVIDNLKAVKSKKYITQSRNMVPEQSPVLPQSIPQSIVTPVSTNNETSTQLELDLNPSQTTQIITTLEGIESVLNRIYNLMVKFDKLQEEKLQKKLKSKIKQ